jgi:cobalt-zinc-cadmium efflux system membrane fusion protein
MTEPTALDGRSAEDARTAGWRGYAVAAAVVIAGAAAAGFLLESPRAATPGEEPALSGRTESAGPRLYVPTRSEWATLTTETVEDCGFRSEHLTEGKIAVDEDRSTPIFSPYSGRVVRLLAKPGDAIEKGQALFVVEATDTVQAQNDFIAAIAAMNKAKSALNLAQITDKRNRDLYEGKAVPLKEWQNSQAALVAAENDMRSAETALEAARNRLRILGRSEAEIEAFEKTGRISPDTPVYAPISGTVVQRKVGPGQYVSSSTSDPVFVVGDLSTVWLTAYVRETDAAKVRVEQEVQFTVLAFPERVFKARLNYVAAALDPASRRLMVRATVDNPGELLKPEMFANVAIFTHTEVRAPAVPREALIHEGSRVRVWAVRDDKAIELREIHTGLTNGRMIQVTDGLAPGERIITKGSLFIDRVASGS